MTAGRPRLMTGTRATGELHIGHYFGTIKNWIAMQPDYECFIGSMDWHGMTTAYKDSRSVNEWNRGVIANLIAWGINPEKTTLFIQSRVPEVLELYMIFANLTPLGWLERVPTWKDAIEEAKANDTHNLGRFSYPVLQAADIAIFRGEKVPVGADQVAHLELSREIIRRANSLYKTKLPEPQPVLTETPVVPGLDGRKMSKSYGNAISLTEESGALAKKIRGMPTDPARVRREDAGNPANCNVFTYHKLVSSEDDKTWVVKGCTTAGIGCGDCKGRLAENLNKLLEEPRNRQKELLNNPKQLDSIIAAGCERASSEARKTLIEVKSKMGI
ncbi:MAG: tryptophan--tRNA ligase [Pseudobdellovibrionaceae bacterium]|jgi:tryptophanyl-tRNA synthetase